MMDRSTLTPAQLRLLEEMLAVDEDRPASDPELARRLRGHIEERIAPVRDLVPDGETLRLSKSALSALACDGRYLDLVTGVFAWEVPMVRGKLAHRAIELDWRSDRRLSPREVVDRAWADLALETEMGEFLAGLDPLTAAELRGTAEQTLTDLRDLWPPIDRRFHPRIEHPVAATFADGALEVRGRTDLTLGRIRADRRQLIAIDLKTGWRRPDRERQDLRLYGLLLTLKYGVAPFRLATYYVAEGAWDLEDVTEETLGTAVRRLVDGAVRAARLRYDPPEDADLHLVAGFYCRWCGRAPSCPAYEESQSLTSAP
jgi:hypothetical protein